MVVVPPPRPDRPRSPRIPSCPMQVEIMPAVSGELLSLSCPRSAWLRYHLLTMRLYQNFKKSTKVEQIKVFVKAAKLGDW